MFMQKKKIQIELQIYLTYFKVFNNCVVQYTLNKDIELFIPPFPKMRQTNAGWKQRPCAESTPY